MKRPSLVWITVLLSCLWSLAALGDSYRLGSDDVVRITVYGHPDLTAVSRIAEDGSVTVPAVGRVSLGGLTARQAEQRLVELLARTEIVKDPQVGVFVEQYQSKRVSVLGQVASPGVYAITRGSKITDLISEAGGLSAEAGDLAIVTRTRGGVDHQEQVDLSALFEGRSALVEPTVANGDRIFVPRAERFYVYGEVKRPGAYRLERGMTVLQALSVAGGLTDKGTERGMRIRRAIGGGEEVVPAPLTQPIRADDVIEVKESLF